MTEPNNSWAQPEGGTTTPATPVTPVTSVAPPPIVAPKKKGGGLTNVLLVVAAIVAVGGVTFAVGRATAPAAAPSGFPGRGTGTNGQAPGLPGGSFDPAAGVPGGFPGGFGDRGITITGTVKSIDGTSMTITTEGGTETTVDVSGTTYHSQAAATAADVTAGARVSVSVTGFGGFRGGPNASGAPAASGAPGRGTGTITATDVTITAK